MFREDICAHTPVSYTHLVDEITAAESEASVRAVSLIVKSDAGKRSFKVELAPPEGMSYARDIAKKYGVTYELLTNTQDV